MDAAGAEGTVVLFKSPNEPLTDDPYYQEGRKRGFDVRFVPVLSFRPGKDGNERLREALKAAERYCGLVVTSQQAVHTSDKLCATFRSAAEGAELSPSIFTADNGQQLAGVITNEVASLGHDRLPLLYLCGNMRRDELPTTLREARIAFEELEVYETVARPLLPSDLAFGAPYGDHQQKVDWLCFFSPSGVSAVYEELSKRANTASSSSKTREGKPRVAAIGPTTAKALADTLGQEPDATASSPCARSLFDALVS